MCENVCENLSDSQNNLNAQVQSEMEVLVCEELIDKPAAKQEDVIRKLLQFLRLADVVRKATKHTNTAFNMCVGVIKKAKPMIFNS